MEVEVLDLSQKPNFEKENDLTIAMDLSQKDGSVICVSEDEEDDTIQKIIEKLNTENPTALDVEACHQLLRELDQQLRNEETIEILLAQMKMTQRKGSLTNGNIAVNRQNGMTTDNKGGDCHIPGASNGRGTQSPVITDTIASNSKIGVIQNVSGSAVVNIGLDNNKTGPRMTREMAMQALDQQYMARKALLRKQADKSLSEIPLARASKGTLAQNDLNIVPGTTTNEFVALVGLEEVVKNVQEYRNIAMGQIPCDVKLVFTPFNCVQCGTDFTPLWKRERPGSSSVVCESCCTYSYRKAVQKDYQEKIKLALKKYQDQERDLDRDYKDMLDSPKKFELFRKEQEKKLIAISNNGSRSGTSNGGAAHGSLTKVTSTHNHHQPTTQTSSVTPQLSRSVHNRSSNVSNNTSGRSTTSTTTFQQPAPRHQSTNNGALSTSNNAASASQLTVDQLAYMQMFQALNQLGSSTTMNSQASRQQQQLMQQILQMAYMSSASSLLGGSSSNSTAAANSFVQLLSNMAGLVGGTTSSGVPESGGGTSSSAANNSATLLNYYLSILQQQASSNTSSSDK